MEDTQDYGSNYTLDPNTSVMKTTEWLLTLIILNIPFVGFIMSLIWAFGNNDNYNRRNFCRAYLIIVIIAFVLMIIFASTIFAVIYSIVQDSGLNSI